METLYMMKVREAELDNQAETLRSKIKNKEDIIKMKES
jgi:hypothetical protein